MLVLGVDVGIINLGLCLVETDDFYQSKTLNAWKHIDITVMRHNRVPRHTCVLSHTNCLCDRLKHVFQEEIELFNSADVIVIEQQPPCGHIAVEQLILSEFRQKACLVSPVSMQKSFDMRRLTYEERKTQAQRIFNESRIVPFEVKDLLSKRERSHDVYDAFLIAEYWLRVKRQSVKPLACIQRDQYDFIGLEDCSCVDQYLVQFAFRK